MKLVLFNGNRLGLLKDEQVYDVTAGLPAWDNDFAANWWLRMCHDFAKVRPALEAAAAEATPLPLTGVKLNAPVLNPGKLIACASNYAAHVEEMASAAQYGKWLLDFGVFLKATSSIIGPGETVYLPDVGDAEIHHESELAFVIGKQGKDIPEEEALDYVLGYTGLLDITVRGGADRSQRKSYDGFSPVGPCLVTADEIGDPHNLRIRLWLEGHEKPRQDVNSSDLLVKIPAIIAYTSKIMTLYPGDIFTTGAPPGVGKIVPGDTMRFEIEKIGQMYIRVAGQR